MVPQPTRRLSTSILDMVKMRSFAILAGILLFAVQISCVNFYMSQRLINLEQQAKDCMMDPVIDNTLRFEAQPWQSPRQNSNGRGAHLQLRTSWDNDRIDSNTIAEPNIPSGILSPIDWRIKLSNGNLDIGIPVSGQDEQLFQFFRFLGDSVRLFQERIGDSQQITVRAIVTRYPKDDASKEFQGRLATEAGMNMSMICFAMTSETKFHRAYAINLLHNATRQSADSVLAIVDVDMDVGPRFLHNALASVSNRSVYFPIVFSNYRPTNVELVEQYLGAQHKYSPHRGLWRGFGFGMYALSGADASTFAMDESFEGWGGEDNDFHKRVSNSEGTTLIRKNEHDLIHRWHTKYCTLGGFVEADKLQQCVKSRNTMEGSYFSLLLLNLDASSNFVLKWALSSSRHFSELVAMLTDTKVYRSRMNSLLKEEAKVEVEQALTIHGYNIRDGGAGISRGLTPSVLVGVTASRATFSTRVAESMKTWAGDLPEGVFVRFFVGDLVESAPYASGSPEDIANLASQANITDSTMITVMNGVKDDEYALVGKASSILKYMARAALELKNTSHISWFFDVDDDTYVNTEGLKKFIANRNPDEDAYFGKRGDGATKDRFMLRKGGLVKPYCMGGAGILMTKGTFDTVVHGFDKCVAEAKESQDVLYADVVIGMCVQKQLDIGCWNDGRYEKDTFAQLYREQDVFLKDSDVTKIVTLHSHKAPGMMTKTHEHIQEGLRVARGKSATTGNFLRKIMFR